VYVQTKENLKKWKYILKKCKSYKKKYQGPTADNLMWWKYIFTFFLFLKKHFLFWCLENLFHSQVNYYFVLFFGETPLIIINHIYKIYNGLQPTCWTALLRIWPYCKVFWTGIFYFSFFCLKGNFSFLS